jgi:uncharacterized protein HemX
MQKSSSDTPISPASPRQSSGSGIACLLAFLAGAAAGIGTLLFLRRRRANRNVRLEDLRKAYAGLSPDEEEE